MYQSLNTSEQKSFIYHLIHRESKQFNIMVIITLLSSVLKCAVTVPVFIFIGIRTPDDLTLCIMYYLSVLVFVVGAIIMDLAVPVALLDYIKKINPTPLQSIVEQYKHALVEYCIDNTMKTSHQQQRIFAVNYHLKCVFYMDGNPVDAFKDLVEAESNAIYESHITGFRYHNRFERSTKTSKDILFTQIMHYVSFAIYILLLSWAFPGGLLVAQNEYSKILVAIAFVVGIICELIIYRVLTLLKKIILCYYSIFPYAFDKDSKWERWPWQARFTSAECMIHEIEEVHYIMFGQYEQLKTTVYNNDVFSTEISSIIVEYLWMPLPKPDNIIDFQMSLSLKNA